MNKSPHTKAHTFASHTCLCTDQSLQKSVLFTDPRRNSIYFLPFLRCFNFFATHNQPDKTAKHKADKDFNNLTDRTPACNSGLAKLAGFSAPQKHLWLIKHWFSAPTFVVKIANFL